MSTTLKVLYDRAKALRAKPTPAEALLLTRLYARRLGDYKWRFSSMVAGFIPDFRCPLVRLVVEVDGGYHDDPDQVRRDAWRTKKLLAQGWTVIRFRNEEVLNDIDAVTARILATCHSLPMDPDVVRLCKRLPPGRYDVRDLRL